MKDKEIIEEIAITISGSTEIDTIEYYNALIKAKQIYEIIFPEDSVVLSREEYERFVELEKKSNRIVIDFAKIDRWRKDGVFCAVNKIKTELNEYRLNNEYFIENEPNGNLWQMNSSIFYLEVLDKGGLIDQIAENHFKISEQEYSGIKEEIDQAVKEMAEKILNETMHIPVIEGKFVKVDDLIDKLKGIATREGVEIKE